MDATIQYISGTSFPYVVTSITNQGTDWGDRFKYVPATIEPSLPSNKEFAVSKITNNGSTYEPAGSPTQLPWVEGEFEYTSAIGRAITATPNVPPGCTFFAWRANVRHSSSALVWVVGPNQSRAAALGASAWSVNSNGVLTTTTYQGPDSAGYTATDWIAFVRRFVVTCVNNDGTSGSTTHYERFQLPTISREGYILSGWYTAASGGVRVGGGGDTYTPSSDITLYAHWELEPVYLITFDANGGTGAPQQDAVPAGNFTIPDTIPTREGKAFTGWSLQQQATVGQYYPGDSVYISTDTTLYAIWGNPPTPGAHGPVPTVEFINYTRQTVIIFSANVTSYSLPDDVYVAPNDTNIYGVSTTGHVPVVSSNDSRNVIANYDGYSISASHVSRIGFTTSGGPTQASGSVTFYQSADSSSESYGFLIGLSSVSQYGTRIFDDLTLVDSSSVTISGDYLRSSSSTFGIIIPLRVIKYTVTFNANGGTGAPGPQSTRAGLFVVPDTVPTREGMTFLGWATNAQATAPEYLAGGTLTVSSNVTLYAVWTIYVPPGPTPPGPTPPGPNSGYLLFSVVSEYLQFGPTGHLVYD